MYEYEILDLDFSSNTFPVYSLKKGAVRALKISTVKEQKKDPRHGKILNILLLAVYDDDSPPQFRKNKPFCDLRAL